MENPKANFGFNSGQAPPPYGFQQPPAYGPPPPPAAGFGPYPGQSPSPYSNAGMAAQTPGQYQPITTQPTSVVIVGPTFGPTPATLTCPTCGNHVQSQTESTPGVLTFVACGVIFIVGCVFGCCLVPFCIDDCQNIEHRCPHCRAHLGEYKRC